MANGYVDIASPILEAYFKGKQLKEQREYRQQQVMMEQEKMKQQGEEFKLAQQHRDNVLKQAKEFHDDEMERQKRQYDTVNKANEFANAIRVGQLVEGHRRMRQELGGAPTQKFQLPMTADDPNTVTAEKPVDTEYPWKGIPGLENVGVDLRGTSLRGTRRDEKDEERRQRAYELDEKLRSAEAQKQADRESRENISQWRNDTMAAIKAMSAGGRDNDPKTVLRLTTAANRAIEQVGRSKEGQNLTSSKRAMATVDDTWNQTKGMTLPLSGVQGVNLVMQYLQTVTPSNRITDFEFRKVSEADSNTAQTLLRVKKWFESNSITPAVARSLMHEIKKIHEQNQRSYDDKIRELRDTAEITAINNGVDADKLTSIFDASINSRQKSGGQAAEAPETVMINGKPVPVRK